MKIVNRSTAQNQISEFRSDTSVWSLVPHKVSTSSAEIWIGTLFPYLRKPKLCRIVVYQNNQQIKKIDISKGKWERPIRNLSRRFFTLENISGLQAGTEYRVTLYQQLEDDAKNFAGDWLQLKSAYFSTLPIKLPQSSNDAFTIALSSCYYAHKDNGQAASAFKALCSQGNQSVKPDIKFMVGDQVYLDIGIDSLSPLTNEVRERIADDYATHWRSLGAMLSRCGTWMLPDDHEYWNDYPFYKTLLPTLYMLRISKVRNAWKAASKDGVERVQQTKNNIEFFDIGDKGNKELSFCLADLRSTRSTTQFIDKKGFKKLVDWAKNLTTPGVLVIPQILIVGQNKNERNLLSFKSQYTRLLEALAHSGRDIVVLSGDVHFGRISTVGIGKNGAKLVEVVASPTSNLTGINSIATAKPKSTPSVFPDPNSNVNVSWSAQKVSHNRNYQITTTRGKWFSTYWKERTKEHIMTVGFNKQDGQISMMVQGWLIRDVDKNGMPKPQFASAFHTTLN